MLKIDLAFGTNKLPERQFNGSSHTTLVKEPPSGDEWLHELKFDGYRMRCRIDRGRVTVWSRNGKDWTEKFQNVVEAVKSLKATSAMLDGEIVIVDAQGVRVFRSCSAQWAKPRRLALLTRCLISFISTASASLKLHSSIGKNC